MSVQYANGCSKTVEKHNLMSNLNGNGGAEEGKSKSDDKSQSLFERIDEAERSFALRQFQDALDLANDILGHEHEHEHEHMTMMMMMPSSTIDSASLLRDDVQVSSQHAFVYDVRVSNLNMPNPTDHSMAAEDAVDLQGTDDFSDPCNTTTFTVSVVMDLRGTKKSTVLERASAISIQSCYELWKKRSCDSEKIIDDVVRMQLSPFLKSYNKSWCPCAEEENALHLGLGEQGPGQSFMTLELLVLYIHFSHAIGLHHAALISSLEVFSAMIDIEQKFSDGNFNYMGGESSIMENLQCDNSDFDVHVHVDEFLYDNCSDLLNLILVQTLSRCEDLRMVETMADIIFVFVQNKKDRDQTKQKLLDESYDNNSRHNLKMSSLPNKASLEVLCRNVEAIIACEDVEGNLSGNIREAMQDTLLDLKEVLLNTDEQRNSNSSISSAVEAATRRLNEENINDDALLDNDVDDEKGTHFDGLYHYFWKSDDRWVNRSKALAVGILTYSVFKQRRRIGRVVASPIREIVHAIIPPK